MDKKNPGQSRNERPNDVEEERSDKSGLKSETKSQGLKDVAMKIPEGDPAEVDNAEDDEDDETDDDVDE